MIKKKFTVTLKPDTLQTTYLSMEDVELTPHILKFADGSIRVTLPEMETALEHRYLSIDVFIEDMDDIMVVAQIKDIVDRLSVSPRLTTLAILSPVYSRYDRVMLADQTDSFGAEVFANFINAMKFSFVQFFDCHSEVLTKLVDNSINIHQNLLLTNYMEDLDIVLEDAFNLVAPDKGAAKKLPTADLIFGKVRNLATGAITGMSIEYSNPNVLKDYLVVDDICEGGRTFLELAKLFKAQDAYKFSQLNLYVTHGIFTNNALDKLLEDKLFDNIYVYFMKKSVYDQVSESVKARINVKTLIDV